MVVRKHAQELILGMSRDPIFGPAILFGAGGVAVEVMDDTAIALPPLDDVLAGDLIERTRIGRLLAGFRDRKPADRKAIAAALNGLSQMIVDFPCIVSIDINPLLADAEGVDRARRPHRDRSGDASKQQGPNPGSGDPALSGGLGEGFRGRRCHAIHIRPIKPADIGLYPEFLAKVSPDDIRLRFLAPRKSFADDMLKRLTQLDYDRDMAFVALEAAQRRAWPASAGCPAIPTATKGEYALAGADRPAGPWARAGHLLSQIVDYAKAEAIRPDRRHRAQRKRQDARRCAASSGSSMKRHPERPGLMHRHASIWIEADPESDPAWSSAWNSTASRSSISRDDVRRLVEPRRSCAT